MEDALISPEGFMILSGAGLIDASETPINVHVAEKTDGIIAGTSEVYVITDQELSDDDNATIYVMPMVNDEIQTEPFIGTRVTATVEAVPAGFTDNASGDALAKIKAAQEAKKLIVIKAIAGTDSRRQYDVKDITKFGEAEVAMVDYYTKKTSGAQQIDITPDKFGGNYYLEASTLFRDQQSGADYPAEFIIPNCKIQSNFTFSMASSGDPSTFTFTMDAFPDYTRFNKTKKVLAAIQIVGGSDVTEELVRPNTNTTDVEDANGIIVEPTGTVNS